MRYSIHYPHIVGMTLIVTNYSLTIITLIVNNYSLTIVK